MGRGAPWAGLAPFEVCVPGARLTDSAPVTESKTFLPAIFAAGPEVACPAWAMPLSEAIHGCAPAAVLAAPTPAAAAMVSATDAPVRYRGFDRYADSVVLRRGNKSKPLTLGARGALGGLTRSLPARYDDLSDGRRRGLVAGQGDGVTGEQLSHAWGDHHLM